MSELFQAEPATQSAKRAHPAPVTSPIRARISPPDLLPNPTETAEPAAPSTETPEPEAQAAQRLATEVAVKEDQEPALRAPPRRTPSLSTSRQTSTPPVTALTTKQEPPVGAVQASADVSDEPSPRPEAKVDPELADFRKAHHLHFEANAPRAALSAYRSYLSQYPAGRFVPEARYNIAINLLRLGDKEAAARALQPFANGDYGNYRKQQAQALLDALR